MIYPAVFAEPIDAPYHPGVSDEQRRRMAIADQCSAWGCCMAGSHPPESFGMVMVKLGKLTGATAPDDVLRAAESINRQSTT